MNAQAPVIPYQVSRRTLARASGVAAAGAAIILTLFVLPAEYGIDLTGVGKALGLTKMASAEDEADTETASAAAAAAPAMIDYTVPEQSKVSIGKLSVWREDAKTIVLPAHSGVEIKARMKAGDSFQFRWKSDGAVRMDMHGEPKGAVNDEFTSYWKEKGLTAAQGSFTAPFEGTHGWYWRNGGETPVTITVNVSGFYETLFQPAGG